MMEQQSLKLDRSISRGAIQISRVMVAVKVLSMEQKDDVEFKTRKS